MTITSSKGNSGDDKFEGTENVQFRICIGPLNDQGTPNDPTDDTCPPGKFAENTNSPVNPDQDSPRYTHVFKIEDAAQDIPPLGFSFAESSCSIASRGTGGQEENYALSNDSEKIALYFRLSDDSPAISESTAPINLNQFFTWQWTTAKTFTLTMEIRNGDDGILFGQNRNYPIASCNDNTNQNFEVTPSGLNICNLLPGEAVIEWAEAAGERRPHYQVTANPGSINCPKREPVFSFVESEISLQEENALALIEIVYQTAADQDLRVPILVDRSVNGETPEGDFQFAGSAQGAQLPTCESTFARTGACKDPNIPDRYELQIKKDFPVPPNGRIQLLWISAEQDADIQHEQLGLSLGEGDGYRLDADAFSTTVMIQDNDREPQLSFGSAGISFEEGEEESLRIVLSPNGRDCDELRALTFNYSLLPTGIVQLGCQQCKEKTLEPVISPDTGQGSFQLELADCPAGTRPLSLEIEINATTAEDQLPEDAQSIAFRLQEGNGYELLEPQAFVFSLEDDDTQTPTLSFETDSSSFEEGQTHTIKASLTPLGQNCNTLKALELNYTINPASLLSLTCAACTETDAFKPGSESGTFQLTLPNCNGDDTPPINTALEFSLSATTTADDETLADPQQVALTFTAADTSAYAIGNQGTHTITIVDDDRQTPTLSFETDSSSFEEGQTHTIKASLTPLGQNCNTLKALELNYTINPASLLSLTCAACTETDAFKPGSESGTFQLTLPNCNGDDTPPVNTVLEFSLSATTTADDDTLADPQQVALTFTAAGTSAYAIGNRGTHTITIVDDDRQTPTLSFETDSSSFEEGQTHTIKASLTPLGQNCNTLKALELNYTINPASLLSLTCAACTETDAFKPGSESGTFQLTLPNCNGDDTPPVNTVLEFSLSATTTADDDTLADPQQVSLTFTAAGTSAYAIGNRGTHTITIVDDDRLTPTLSFETDSSSFEEGQTHTIKASLTPLGQNCNTLKALELNYTINPASLLSLSCAGCTESNAFKPGSESGTFQLALPNCNGDDTPPVNTALEFSLSATTTADDETLADPQQVALTFTAADTSAYAIGDQGEHTITIVDDDRLTPTLSFETDSSSFEEGQTHTIKASLTPLGQNCNTLKALELNYTINPASLLSLSCAGCTETDAFTPGSESGTFQLTLPNCNGDDTPPINTVLEFSLSATTTADDDTLADPQQVSLSFTAADTSAYAIGNQGEHTITIVDDDRQTPTLSFETDSSSFEEGQTHTIKASLTPLGQNCNTLKALELNYTINPASLLSLSCAGCTETDAFKPGSESGTFQLTLPNCNGDDTPPINTALEFSLSATTTADDETLADPQQVALTFTAADTSAYAIGNQGTHTITIVDDDRQTPTLSFETDSSSFEEGQTHTIKASLTPLGQNCNTLKALELNYTINPASLLSLSCAGCTESNAFKPGSESGTFQLTLPNCNGDDTPPINTVLEFSLSATTTADDDTLADPQQVALTFTAADTSAYAIGNQGTHTITIVDDDRQTPTLSFETDSSSFEEGQTHTIRASLTPLGQNCNTLKALELNYTINPASLLSLSCAACTETDAFTPGSESGTFQLTLPNCNGDDTPPINTVLEFSLSATTTADDDTLADPQQVSLTFTAADTSAYAIGDQGTHTITIVDDDRQTPTLSFETDSSSFEEGQTHTIKASLTPLGQNCNTLKALELNYTINPASLLSLSCAGCTETDAFTPGSESGTFQLALPSCNGDDTPPVNTVLEFSLSATTTADDDTLADPQQVSLSFTAADTSAYAIGNQGEHTITIVDDDRQTPTLSFETDSSSFEEGQTHTIKASLTPLGQNCNTLKALELNYTINPASLLSLSCAGCTETDAFTPGSESGTFQLTLPNCNGDDTPPVNTVLEFSLSATTTDDDETLADPQQVALTFTAADTSAYAIGNRGTHTITIVDDDRQTPTLSFETDSSSFEEGQTHTIKASLTPLGQNCNTLKALELNYTINPASLLSLTCAACTETDAFKPGSESGTFQLTLPNCNGDDTPPVNTALEFSLSATTTDDDEILADPQQVSLTFTAAGTSAYAIGDRGTHTITIVDDDKPPLTLSFKTTSSEVTEGGTVMLEAEILLNGSDCDTLRALELGYSIDPAGLLTVSCNECDPQNFNTNTGTFRLQPSSCPVGTTPTIDKPLNFTLLLTALDNNLPGPPQDVNITFIPGTGYELTPQPSSRVTILDDDKPPLTLSFKTTSSEVTEGGTVMLEAEILLNGSDCNTLRALNLGYSIDPAGLLTVSCNECDPQNFNTNTGTFRLQPSSCPVGTTPTIDKPLNFTLLLTALDNNLPGPPQDVNITFIPGTGYELTPQPSSRVTILDDDKPPLTLSFKTTSSEVTEGGTVTLEAEILLNGSDCNTLRALNLGYSIDPAGLLTVSCNECDPQNFNTNTGTFRLQPSSCPVGTTPTIDKPLNFTLLLTALDNNLPGPPQDVTITFIPGTGYELAPQSSSRITIQDNDGIQVKSAELSFRTASSTLRTGRTINVVVDLIPNGNDCNALQALSFNYRIEHANRIQVACNDCNPNTIGSSFDRFTGVAEGSFSLSLRNCPPGQMPDPNIPLTFSLTIGLQGGGGGAPGQAPNILFMQGQNYSLGPQSSHKITIQ